MKPYTTAALDQDMREAINSGQLDAMTLVGAAVDARDDNGRPTSLRNSALWYIDQGLRVFPVMAGSKKPYPHTHGLLDASSDEGEVLLWWDRWPDANIGIATGHLVDVIDFDGLPGHQSWAAAGFPDPDDGSTMGGAPVYGTVSTPRAGGFHVYVPASGRGNMAGHVGNRLPGLDYRGVGGYVVAPPSTTPVGTYRWLRPLRLPHG